MSSAQFTDELRTGTVSDQQTSTKARKSGFMRGLSRKKSVKVNADIGTPAEASANPGKVSHRMSRKRSLCDKITRVKEEPQYGSRSKTGEKTLKAKERVLEKYPGLNIEPGRDRAEELVLQGLNSIRAETIDFYGMVMVMQDNAKMLTHAAVGRFLDWIPLFGLYLDRYLLVEEDFLFKWVERKVEALKGELRPSARMVMHGKIQKAIRDVQEAQDMFMPQLPPGERLHKLVEIADIFTSLVEEHCVLVSRKLPPLIREHYCKSEIEKARTKIIKHVVAHIGYQDFVVLYTRWMRAGDLLEWKTSVLFPCDFKFFSYATWEKDMDFAHYQIAAQFAELLEEENREAVELNKQSKADFERAVATRQNMEPLEEVETEGLVIDDAEETEHLGKREK